MSDRIKIRISGPYSENVVSAAINGLGDQADEAVRFKFGELTHDRGFSPELAAAASVSEIIGAVLAATQLAVSLVRRRRDSANDDSQPEISGNDLRSLAGDALPELPQARDYRITFSVDKAPADEINLQIAVSSRVRLESVKAQVLVTSSSIQCELTIGPVRRGEP